MVQPAVVRLAAGTEVASGRAARRWSGQPRTSPGPGAQAPQSRSSIRVGLSHRKQLAGSSSWTLSRWSGAGPPPRAQVRVMPAAHISPGESSKATAMCKHTAAANRTCPFGCVPDLELSSSAQHGCVKRVSLVRCRWGSNPTCPPAGRRPGVVEWRHCAAFRLSDATGYAERRRWICIQVSSSRSGVGVGVAPCRAGGSRRTPGVPVLGARIGTKTIGILVRHRGPGPAKQ